MPGCTDAASPSFVALATANDGSCKLGGCMLPAAVNLNATAELDDATCVPGITGCTDPTALHYSSAATIDDGSCIPTVVGCMWPDSHNYNPAATRGDQRLCYDGLTSPSPAPLGLNVAVHVAVAALRRLVTSVGACRLRRLRRAKRAPMSRALA